MLYKLYKIGLFALVLSLYANAAHSEKIYLNNYELSGVVLNSKNSLAVLYDVNQGAITVDRTNIKDMKQESLRNLLGLGLNFCLRRVRSPYRITSQLHRFIRNICARMIFCHLEKDFDPRLYIPNEDWYQNLDELPDGFYFRVI